MNIGIYFPHITTAGLLPRDDIAGGVMNAFALVIGNSLVTFYLFTDNPHSPQFFYSVLSPLFSTDSRDSPHWIFYFAILETYLTAFSWTTILLWATTSICCAATILFWVQQLKCVYEYESLHYYAIE